ncbi:MAG: hypothetical protein M5U08_14010 [Burkholderiales bacterium]|nr:hypothetical protein [Burkholderiales bacterium]
MSRLVATASASCRDMQVIGAPSMAASRAASSWLMPAGRPGELSPDEPVTGPTPGTLPAIRNPAKGRRVRHRICAVGARDQPEHEPWRARTIAPGTASPARVMSAGVPASEIEQPRVSPPSGVATDRTRACA